CAREEFQGFDYW
nr:immunoglobulin heavy chain junction region [Mus musculus]MBK4185857.1 immunoglobulin heavy chain junction region [Mus musculus]MBK4185858.1 immunoglobulin heavy chain junction region [Mus musculus]